MSKPSAFMSRNLQPRESDLWGAIAGEGGVAAIAVDRHGYAKEGPNAKKNFDAEMRNFILGISASLDEQERTLDRFSPSFLSVRKTVDAMPPQIDADVRYPAGFPPGTIIHPEPSAVIVPPQKAPLRR